MKNRWLAPPPLGIFPATAGVGTTEIAQPSSAPAILGRGRKETTGIGTWRYLQFANETAAFFPGPEGPAAETQLTS
jgi:hypothetical protein